MDARRANTLTHAVRHSRPRNTLQDAYGPYGQQACIYIRAAGQAGPERPVEAAPQVKDRVRELAAGGTLLLAEIGAQCGCRSWR